MLKKLFFGFLFFVLTTFSTFASEKHRSHNHHYQEHRHSQHNYHNHDHGRRSWNRHDWARWALTPPVVISGVSGAVIVNEGFNDYSQYILINGKLYKIVQIYHTSCNCTKHEFILVD